MYYKFLGNHIQRFSIRKYAIGIASVCLGLAFIGNPVQADQVTGTEQTIQANVVKETQKISEVPTELKTTSIESEAVKLEDAAEGSHLIESSLSLETEKVDPKVVTATEQVEHKVPVPKVADTSDKTEISGSEKAREVAEVLNKNEKIVDLIKTTGDKTIDNAASNVDKPDASIVDNVASASKKDKENGGESSLKNLKATKSEGYSAFRRAVGNEAIGDDYPKEWNNPNVGDSWGYNQANCTSFVAHRLHRINHFEVPRTLGNARDWGYNARSLGYQVNNTPAVGAVAWSKPFTGGAYDYGHVAWVAAISGNNILLEEYNYAGARYHTRTVNKNDISGFIHFKDLDARGTSTPSNPTPTPNPGIPASGVYHFTHRVSIKAEPKMSSPELAYYDAGQSVNYDRKLEADGHEWISYLSYSGNRRYVAVGTLKTKAPLKGTITIQNNNTRTGSFDVLISDVSSPNGVREVKVPTWSSENGQDDIKWYTAEKQANGTYKVHVKYSDHKNSVGEYNIHLYYVQDNGQMVCVTGTKTNVSAQKPEGKLTIQNNNPKTGTFDVVVSNVSSPFGVKKILLPTWSSEKDQDDVRWYEAAKQADGTYKITVKASDHKNSVGEYNIHLYYVQENGQMVGVGGTKTIVSLDKTSMKPTGTITIVNNNSQTGTFDIIVSNVSNPNGVREVKLPTWSAAGGQDDIVWHVAIRQADGTYKFTVKASDHKNSTGEYIIHLYYVQDDGTMVGVGAATTTVSLPTVSIPPRGTYVFKGYASIRAEAKLSSPELANFNSGDSVFYDQAFLANGHQWISYIGYSGNRRYVAIN